MRGGLLAVLLAGVLVFPGCSDNGEKTLNLPLDSFALSLSPLKINETESAKVAALLYSPLVSVSAGGKVTSRLAQSWQETVPGTYRFVLKKGITFTSGAPVNAEMVVASLCRAMQPTSAWAWALRSIDRTLAENGKSVRCTGLKTIDDRTLEITQSKPVDWLLHALDGPPGWITPADAKEGEYGVLPGSGPYVIEKINRDTSVVLRARENGSDIPPHMPWVMFTAVTDDAQAVALFKSGKLDALPIITPTRARVVSDRSLQAYADKAGGSLINVLSDRVRVAIVNQKRLEEIGFSPANIAAFKAVLWANVDRSAVSGPAAKGLAVPLNTVFLPAAPQPPRERIDYPPALPTGNLVITTESDPYSDLIASTIAKTRIPNLKLSYQGVQKGRLIGSLLEGTYDIASIAIDANVHAPQFWGSFFSEGNPFTAFGMTVPGVAETDMTTSEGQRAAQKLIDQNGNWIPIVRERRVVLVASGVKGIRVTPSGQISYELARKD